MTDPNRDFTPRDYLAAFIFVVCLILLLTVARGADLTRALILNAVSTPEQARKFSLKHQHEVSSAFAASQDWSVVDSLSSDTSRSKHDNIDDIARVNKAFAALKQHIEQRDFDVLVIHSFDRLARDPALIVQLIQRVIRAGAAIYSHQGGQVDQTNYLILCGAIAFMVAAPIRTFVEKSQSTKEKQAAHGLHAQGRTLMIHTIARNDRGERVAMKIREEARPLFSRLIALLCDDPRRLSWADVGIILNSEGFSNPATGKPLRGQNLYRTVVHPEFWGHSARNYARTIHARKTQRYSYEWVFDPDCPPPAGVRIYYNTHEPFLSAEEAEKLKARLRQDFALSGKALHGNLISAFSGLVICAHCGLTMPWHHKRDYYYANCEGRWSKPPTCSERNAIDQPAVAAALDQRLRELSTASDLSAFSSAEASASRQRISELQSTVAGVERELFGLLRDKATADAELLPLYTELIASANSKLKAARSALIRAQSETISDDADYARKQAAEEIIALTVDGFWELPIQRQNRLLHQLFGHYRLVADQRQIVGIARGKRQKHLP